MFKRIKRRIRRAGEKIERLFGDREPTIPGIQAPVDSNPEPAPDDISASPLATVVESHSERCNDARRPDLTPGAPRTMDQDPSVASLDPGHNQAERSNQQPATSPVPEPENNTAPVPTVDLSGSCQSKQDIMSTAWPGLKALIGAMSESARKFGPLGSAIGGLLRCIEIHEDQVAAHEDYRRIKIDLESVCQEIAGYMSGSVPPSMESKVAELTERLEEEISLIDQKTQRSRLGRYMEAADDMNETLMRYRRIQGHLDAFARSVGMSIWQIVDEQATRSRLKELPNSPAAKYCSTESRSLGRNECTPDTRLDVMRQLRDWAQDSKSKRVYWLNGMAGTGKTTIAYSLCSELERGGQLAASFFCSRQLPACRNVGIILPTIAYQLALSSRPYRYELSGTLERDPDVHNQPVDHQFHSLIAAPLRKVRKQLRRNLVLVVDALDECKDGDSVGQMLSALLAEVVDLPVKIFFTSRPNSEILNQMESEQGHNVRSELRLHALERSVVQSDIKTYLGTELSDLRLEPTALDELVERSGVLFIYAATVVRYVKNKSIARSNERLKRILSAEPVLEEMIHRDIDYLYNAILSDALDNRLIATEQAEMKVTLHTVICAQEPLSVDVIAGLLDIDVELVMDILQPLLPVLQISDETRLVTMLHESFPDYLFDINRSGGFSCDARQQHSFCAQVCFDLLKNMRPQFNICILESSYIPDAEVSDLSNRVSTAISDHLFYGCRYWEAHLELTGSPEKLMEKLEEILSTRLFLWMEIMGLKHNIDASVVMMSKLDVWLSQVQAPASTRELAHDAWRFMNAFASGPIRHMTPHIYISALALWPRHRPLSRYRSNRFPSLAEAAGTALDRRDATPLATLNAPARVCCVACSPDGARIISGCENSTICIWNAHTGQQIGEPLFGHTHSVECVAISPDGRRIVSGSSDATIRTWDIYTGEMLGAPFEGHTNRVRSVNYSPNGAHIVSGSMDATIRIWDVETGQMLVQPLEGHTGSVYSVAYSPDGAYIVSGSADMTIRVWDAQTGRLRGQPLEGHTGEIYAVAYSPDGTYIVSGSYGKTARIWDAETGQMSTKPLEGPVLSVAYSPDGARIVSNSADDTICIWDAGTGQILGQPLMGHTGSVRSVSFSSDGLRIISGSYDNTIRIWDAYIGQSLGQPPEGHTDVVNSVAYSPDGARIASGSGDNTICIWDAYTGRMVGQPLKGHISTVYSVAYSLDGTRIASGSDDRTIRIWDASSGQMVGQLLEGHAGAVYSVAFSPDGSRIASGSADNTVCIWDAHVGQMVGQPLKGHTSIVCSVMFSPDGARIVSGSADKTICIWDANTGQTVGQPLKGHTNWVGPVAYSPSGTHIVSGSDFNETIRIWDARTGQMVGQPREAHTSTVTSVAYSPDGARIVSGSHDKTLCIWDAHTGQMLGQPLEGHTGWVQSVAYSPDGKHVVSGSYDGSIRIWDVCSLSNLSKKYLDNANSIRQPSLSLNILQPIPNTSSRTHKPRTKTRLPMRPNLSGMCSIPRSSSSYSLYDGSITLFLPVTPDPNAWTLSKDGWVVGHDLKPLLWVPPELRDTLQGYRNTCMISKKGSWALNLSKAKFGTEWQQCYRS